MVQLMVSLHSNIVEVGAVLADTAFDFGSVLLPLSTNLLP